MTATSMEIINRMGTIILEISEKKAQKEVYTSVFLPPGVSFQAVFFHIMSH